MIHKKQESVAVPQKSDKFQSFFFLFVSQATIEGAAGPEGGAGEAGRSKPEAFSGKRAADVQAETQRLVSDHPPGRHDAGDLTQMTRCPSA